MYHYSVVLKIATLLLTKNCISLWPAVLSVGQVLPISPVNRIEKEHVRITTHFDSIYVINIQLSIWLQTRRKCSIYLVKLSYIKYILQLQTNWINLRNTFLMWMYFVKVLLQFLLTWQLAKSYLLREFVLECLFSLKEIETQYDL